MKQKTSHSQSLTFKPISLTTLFFALSIAPSQLFAKELSFEDVWNSISNHSSVQKAGQQQKEAAAVAETRSKLHWTPRIYAGASSYSTNNSGAVFFGLLEQREVEQTDFDPDSLNHPGNKSFVMGKIGLDLPLYEGGMKTSQVKMQGHLLKAKAQEDLRMTNQEYAQAALSYGSMAVLTQQESKLKEIQKTVDRLKSSYRLGDQSNSVGYSGLLGMKALSNRIEGVLYQYQAQNLAYRQALDVMSGDMPNEWSPQLITSIQFSDRYFKVDTNQHLESPSQAAMIENSLAAQEGAEMEKARFRPRVGVFAEYTQLSGERGNDGSYIGGLYLQWSLFDAGNYGKTKEAQLLAQSARHFASAIGTKDQAETQGLLQAKQALQKNIELIQQSEEIMVEQNRVTENLFRNGSVNILQLVELLSRRIDLIISQTEANISYLKTNADLIQKTGFHLSKLPLKNDPLK